MDVSGCSTIKGCWSVTGVCSSRVSSSGSSGISSSGSSGVSSSGSSGVSSSGSSGGSSSGSSGGSSSGSSGVSSSGSVRFLPTLLALRYLEGKLRMSLAAVCGSEGVGRFFTSSWISFGYCSIFCVPAYFFSLLKLTTMGFSVSLTWIL